MTTPRVSAVIALVVLAAVGGVTAALAVPWRQPRPGRAAALAALSELPPEAVARGRACRSALRPARFGSMLVGLAAAVVFGLTAAGARLVEAVARPFGGQWMARAVLGGLAVVLATGLVTVPFAAWRRVVLRRFGLSTQSWGGWAADLLKGYALTAVLGGSALLGFYAVARALPRWWWPPVAVAGAAVMMLLAFVFPVLVEPLFNRFAAMPEGPLRRELIALAARDGVPVRDVLVADASRRTRAVNAYVSGYGATRRIVVYDTLLERADPAEVVGVMAHELGHAKRGDELTAAALGALGAAGAVIVVYLLGGWTALLHRAGAAAIGEPRSIGLVLLFGTLAGVLATPLTGLASRRVEARADAHALALTADPGAFARMQARLSTANLADPDPPRWEQALFATHPSTVARIAAARAYERGRR